VPRATNERGQPIRWVPRKDRPHARAPVPESRQPYVQPAEIEYQDALADVRIIDPPACQSVTTLRVPSHADLQFEERLTRLEEKIDRLLERVAELELEDA